MSEPRRVLITGIAGHLAGRLARELEQRDGVSAVVGVDVREPTLDLRRTEFVRADLRNPLVAKVITEAAIDTVVHLGTMATPRAAGGRARMKESNVIGAMQLLAACQQAPSVRRFVLKSFAAVYGSEFTDPASFAEDDVPAGGPKHGFGRDVAEVEAYVRTFGRRRKDVDVTLLRFANLLGDGLDSAFRSLFALPVVPSVLGFDPRLQFVHEDDALGVLAHVVNPSHPGTFNVAGDGVLYLSQCIRIAGRFQVPVPAPFVTAVAAAARRSGRADITSDQLRFLQFGRVLDTTRLHDQLGYQPRYSTRQAFEDFARRGDDGGADVLARWERVIQEAFRGSRAGAGTGPDDRERR